MALKSVNKILGNDAFWQEDKDALKYIHHQFQDYGYRLALKLGDLQHKAIYIKLAKTTPRHLIEKAAAFASDFPQETNKGKLFMWQLKQLRIEQEEKEHEHDFSTNFVWRKVSESRAALQEIIAKKEADRSAHYLKLIELVQPHIGSGNKRQILDPMAGLAVEASIWQSLGWKYTAWENNKYLIERAKKQTKNLKIVYKKDALTALAKVKVNSLDVIWMPRLWELVSFDGQIELVAILKKLLRPEGLIVFTATLGQEAAQKWELHNITKDHKVWLYHQTHTASRIQTALTGFAEVESAKFDQNRTAMVWRLGSS